MTNLDPHEYKNGIKVGETVSTSDPNVVLGKSKAVAAFVATVVVAFLTALGTALVPDSVGVSEVTGSEWVTIALATVIGTGLVGGTVYGVATKVTVK